MGDETTGGGRVSMTAIAAHTCDGVAREPGDVYEVDTTIDPMLVGTLGALKFARPTAEIAAAGKAKAKAAKDPAAPAADAGGKHPVTPMGTADFPGAAGPHK